MCSLFLVNYRICFVMLLHNWKFTKELAFEFFVSFCLHVAWFEVMAATISQDSTSWMKGGFVCTELVIKFLLLPSLSIRFQWQQSLCVTFFLSFSECDTPIFKTSYCLLVQLVLLSGFFLGFFQVLFSCCWYQLLLSLLSCFYH